MKTGIIVCAVIVMIAAIVLWVLAKNQYKQDIQQMKRENKKNVRRSKK